MAVLKDGAHYSRSGYISKDPYEEEADAFASEFLMPWKLAGNLVRGGSGGFASIKSLADQCGSSLVASAIRYADVTEEKVAVVVSHLGAVEFMTASPAFRQLPGIDWLRRWDALPTRVSSARFGTDHAWVGKGSTFEADSHLTDWFPGAPRTPVREDVVGLGSYGRLLTVLVADYETGADGDEEVIEDDYIERWKEGRFRKR